MAHSAIARRILILHKFDLSTEEVIRLFLLHSGRSATEYDGQRHFIHLRPNERKPHEFATILVDWDYGSHPLRDLGDVPLEIYKARHLEDQDEMYRNLHLSRAYG